MFQAASPFLAFRSLAQLMQTPSTHGHHHHRAHGLNGCSGITPSESLPLGLTAGRGCEALDLLGQAWSQLCGSNGASHHQASGSGLSTLLQGLQQSLATPHIPETELQKGQSRDFGRDHVQVDNNGALTFTQDGATSLQMESCTSWNGNGHCGSVNNRTTMSMKQSAAQQVRVENGQIHLPNGKTVPFNNRGAIVEMADGTQIGVGRNSESSPQQNRWAVAGAGEEIPVSPPGFTTVYKLNQAGDVVSQSTR